MYEKIKAHIGHEIVIVGYGNFQNVAVECETCNCVVVDAENESL